MKKKILHLTLEKVYFDAIAMKKKFLEYREIKEYWIKRLYKESTPIDFDEIHFKNGYGNNVPFMKVKWNGFSIRRQGNVSFYAIDVSEILEIKNWKAPEITSASPTSNEGMELRLNSIPELDNNKNSQEQNLT